MDNDGNIFDDRSNRTPSGSNSNLPSWQNIWDLRFDWNNNSAVAACVCSSDHSLAGTGSASGSSFRPDRPPPSLKLGKRQYLERSSPPHPRDVHAAGGSVGKRPRDGEPPPPPSSSPVGVPDCQVDDCHVALAGAKEYHRRHKVCEMHAKAPKVLVRGFEQRFCQQCSRFHAVSAFDDSKRSCRRRLAGHNERRRKSSLDPMLKTPTRRPDLLASAAAGRALSLLSSESDSLLSPADLSLRSSAALRELIAENRASIFSRQLFLHQSHHATEDLGRTRVSPQS